MRFGKQPLAVCMLTALVAFATPRAQAQSVTWTGPGDGDSGDMIIAFPGFIANHLDSITGPGYAHNHGDTSVIFTVDLGIDGVFQTVDSYTLDGNDHALSERGPVAFTQGTVTGIRLTDTPNVGNGYHGFYSSQFSADPTTVFNFSTVASPVPEPGSIALFAGMGLSGAAFVRRRKNAHKAA